MTDPVIRPARTADRPGIAALMAASWQSVYAPVLPAAVLDGLPARFAEKWRDHAGGPEDLVMVAERDGALLGFAAFLGGDPLWLDNLHVHPGLRGGGIGRRLLAGCVAPLRARGVTRVELTVVEGNTAARAFYARMGGRPVARETVTLLGTEVTVLRLRWDDIGTWDRIAAGTPS